LKPATALKVEIDVCIGEAGIPVGTLTYVRQGHRENTAFAYAASWLKSAERFPVSPDLVLTSDHQFRKAPSKDDSVFPFALADTEPDAWGRRIIMRAHARRRKTDPQLSALAEVDFLLAVDDFSRIGALRLQDGTGNYHRTVAKGQRATPPLVELQRMYEATRAVENGEESESDLKYLQGKGTSLGGMRPKCTVLDADGTLAIGKFPSINDERSVTRGEVLALMLSKAAGIDTAAARIVELERTPVAIITRFDRASNHGRIPYLSASSMLQASRQDERTYVEVADAIRSQGFRPEEDTAQLWRRLVFNLMITNIDDHLNNLGFLHVQKGLWRLAPAFDVNPFPDRDRESKTMLSDQTGPITDIDMLMAEARYFGLGDAAARKVLGEVCAAVSRWRQLAVSPEIGLTLKELGDFEQAFEHSQMERAQRLI
jgi:serine/threonine-protein kinase HipA